MRNNYKSQRTDYVKLGIKTLDFSSREFLWECVEGNPYMYIKLEEPLGSLKLPFCSAVLVSYDSWTRHFAYSNAHRRLIESRQFAGSIKSFTRWLINNILSGYKEFDLDELSLYGSIYEKFFEVHAPIQYDAVQRFLNPKKNQTILEIGCATGNLSHRLANDVKEVTGMDSSKTYLKRAIKRAKKLGLRNCKFINATYPYNLSRKFDYTIIFNLSLEGEKYMDHLFPSKEVLYGAFLGGEDELIIKTSRRVRKIIHNFEKNYEILLKTETPEEIGEILPLTLMHMKRRI